MLLCHQLKQWIFEIHVSFNDYAGFVRIATARVRGLISDGLQLSYPPMLGTIRRNVSVPA
jgi:hypothetical protein